MTTDKPQPKKTANQSKNGKVVSISGNKTIRVAVSTRVKHKTYGKYIQRRRNFSVHDPRNEAKVGDLVEIVPCRKLSKTKSWRLTNIIRRADIA